MHRVKKSFKLSPVSAPGNMKRADGFTLLEVMLAATVMVLAIASSIIVLQQALRAMDTARYTTLAGQILQSQMEKLRLLNWGQMTEPTYGAVKFTTFPAEVATVPTAEMERFVAEGFTGRCSQLIAPAAGPTAELAKGMLQITLTATWRGLDGRLHSLSYISFYGQFGLSDFFYTSH